MQVGGPGSQETWDNVCPLIKASLSLWSQQSFSNKAQTTERSPMLPWAPSCLWGDSCTVVIPPAHQRPVFFISLFAQVSCYQLTQQRSQSSPCVFVNILQLTCLQFVMCVYFFSAGVAGALTQTTAATTSLGKHPILALLFEHTSWVL